MHYTYEIDITPAHTVLSPLVVPIKLNAGVLFNADLLFEVGDGYSSCIELWDKSTQILPTNQESWYSADGLLISAPCWYSLSDNGNDLYVIAWNRGGVYNHTVTLMLSVKDPAEPDLYSILATQNDLLYRQIEMLRSML